MYVSLVSECCIWKVIVFLISYPCPFIYFSYTWLYLIYLLIQLDSHTRYCVRLTPWFVEPNTTISACSYFYIGLNIIPETRLNL
jgi:hypothetical protein